MTRQNNLQNNLLVLVITLFVSACGGLNIGRDAAGNIVLNISLNEAQVSSAIQQAVVNVNINGVSLLAKVTTVDLQAGKIYVAGTHTAQNGTAYNGSMEIYLSSDGTKLIAQIQNVNVEGASISPELIAQVNAQLSAALSAAASNQSGATITKVEVTDSALNLEITIRAK